MLSYSANYAKGFFFDAPLVVKAVDAATRGVLSKFGAYVRRRAKSSIRQRKAASQPGQPPSSHSGILRLFLYFAYDPGPRSVVIGPAKTNQVFFDNQGNPVTGTVPEVLEYGGQVRMIEEWDGEGWIRLDLRYKGAHTAVELMRQRERAVTWSQRRKKNRPIRRRIANIQARPFMNPAFETEKQLSLDKLWADCVKKPA